MLQKENEQGYWKYNSSKEYDIYYEGEENSIFSKLYKEKVIAYDNWIITKLIIQISHLKEFVSFMDVGCGNGRYFVVYQKIAVKLARKNKKLKIFAYDTSELALKQYKNKLLKESFIEDNTEIYPPSTLLNYKIEKLSKDNLTICLVRPFTNTLIKEIDSAIGDIDIVSCAFGVISHIQKAKERAKFIHFLAKITVHKLLISVPSYRILKKERQAFEMLRTYKIDIQIEGKNLELEKGDLLYCRNDGSRQVMNYLHVYESANELLKEINEADLEYNQIWGINRIFHETKLVRYPVLGQIDKMLCRMLSFILPEPIKNKIAGYFIVIINK